MTAVVTASPEAHSLGQLSAPLLAALVSATVAAVVALVVARLTLRAHRHQHIETMISKLIDFSIQYPYLEDDAFCGAWEEADETREDVQRYGNYCCFVFNLLETMWEFHRGRAGRIEAWFNAREMAVRHRVWWTSEADNREGYGVRFQKYVDALIAGGDR